MPPADSPAELRPSPIAGRGLFLTAPVASGAIVDGVDGARLNHSCDPSLGWTPAGGLRARADLDAGTELTIDYATSIDDPDFVMNCHCETYRCRQIIEGTDWQIPQLQLRYTGQFAPALRRRLEDASR